MIYLELFLGFLKVGCFAFGGAYGAIPLIQEVVLGYGWLTQEELAERVGLTPAFIGHLEAPNIMKALSLDALFDIAEALDVPPRKFLDFDERGYFFSLYHNGWTNTVLTVKYDH